MRRKQNWPTLLAIYLEASKKEEFEWGRNDCALFAADWVLIATGEDLAEPFRGHYSTAKGSLMALSRYGCGGGLWKYLDKQLEEIQPNFATQGDVVILETDLGDALGVVGTCGRYVYFRDLEGLSSRPISDISSAWRIP